MSRPRADTIPAVTVPPRPNGLPIAITQSPTLNASELPKLTAVSFVEPGSNFRTAISVFSSRPTSVASKLSSFDKNTVICSAFSITWLLVTTIPLLSMIKPDPSDCALRDFPRSSNSLKKSSKGEPSGNCGRSIPRLSRTIVVVEIFTTAGVFIFASSAKLTGRSLARAGCCKTIANIATKGRTKQINLFRHI